MTVKRDDDGDEDGDDGDEGAGEGATVQTVEADR